MHIRKRKTLIAGAMVLASGAASAHYLPIGATPARVSPGDVIAFGYAPAHAYAHSVCIAAVPLRGVNEVERADFGCRRPAWGNRWLESAAAQVSVHLPPPSPMQRAADGIPPFAFAHLLVTTMTVAQAQRLHIPPLASLAPYRCSTVILVATH
jgi:hypothetical protein